jgi:hypothetical protein
VEDNDFKTCPELVEVAQILCKDSGTKRTLHHPGSCDSFNGKSIGSTVALKAKFPMFTPYHKVTHDKPALARDLNYTRTKSI